MVEDRIETDKFYPFEDMKYEISLLDYKGTTNKGVIYRINEDRSCIYLIKGLREKYSKLNLIERDAVIL